uniref:Uncharacterized protein n=1 Tax=uncultured bacterium AZ_40 TaxID=1630016 RepID=A0A0E3JNP6_9BACT|nr:hypothetical protein [uncultured bacterium AZ_40]
MSKVLGVCQTMGHPNRPPLVLFLPTQVPGKRFDGFVES